MGKSPQKAVEGAERKRALLQAFRRDDWTCQRCGTRRRSKGSLTGHQLSDQLLTVCLPCRSYLREHPELDTPKKISDDYWASDPFPAGASFASNNPRPEWHAWVYGSGRSPLNQR